MCVQCPCGLAMLLLPAAVVDLAMLPRCFGAVVFFFCTARVVLVVVSSRNYYTP